MTPARTWLRTLLINGIVVLSIFCFIQVLPLEAEVQPFGAVLAALFLALYSAALRPATVLYFGALAAGLALTLARSALVGQPAMGTAFSTFLAIGAPVLIFAALLTNTQRIHPGLVLGAIALWLFIGVTQTFLPQLQSAVGLESVLSRLISRYEDEALTESNRGASLLAPEPSYAAHVIFLFLILVLYLARIGRLQRPGMVFGLAGIAVLAFVNRSGTLAMIAFAFAGVYCMLRIAAERSVRSFGLLAAAVLVAVGAVFYASRQEAEGFRAAVVLAAFLEDLWHGELDLVAFTMGFGSIRTISVLTAAHSVLTGNLLGAGLGSWSYRFIDELFALGVNPWELFFFYSKGALVDIKPYSHLAILAFDLGVAGLLIDLLYLRTAFRLSATARGFLRDPLAASVVAVSVVAIAGNTLVSLPAYWITLALGLDLARATSMGAPHEPC